MIYRSEKSVYDRIKEKFTLPEWQLDTEKVLITHTDSETLKTETTSFISDCIRYHLHHLDEKEPERIQQLVNNGQICSYLKELEIKVKDEVSKTSESLMAASKEYQTALESGNLNLVGSLGNTLVMEAEHIVYDAMIYI